VCYAVKRFELIHWFGQGVVVFGDPFNGAPIKGYPTSKIKTYCIASDDVCGGEFSIGIGHLSYTFGSTSDAVKYIKTIV
jgi:hypothetical protein